MRVGPTDGVSAAIDPDGTISVELHGTTVLEPSPFGVPTPHGAFPDDFALDSTEEREIDEPYDLAHGKRSTARPRATEAILAFESDDGRVDLQVRVASDGVAYRYAIPGESGRHSWLRENAGFRLPGHAIGYVMPYVYHHEASLREVPVGRIEGEHGFPALFRVDRDAWVLCCEAGVDGSWSAGRLVGDGEGLFEIDHPRTFVNSPLPSTSPWRVAIVGDLATIVESTMTTDLVDGPRIDADWVEPGRVAWSWWGESGSARDFERQKDYVDYVAERGWEHVLVDAGWDEEWMPDLAEYATDRGVGVFVWSHYTQLNSETKRAEVLPRWADWGIAGFKVDFMDSDDQGRLQFYDAVAEAAAEHELMVNFHGSIVPTGLRRRWPHLMTYEGVMGAEWYGSRSLSPEHNTILPFTRNVVGPMDYTPVTFSTDHRATTVGHELALSIVFESGLQHFADSIDEYAARPLAEEFLESVPPTWDETRFLRGKPGAEATLARRGDDRWFVGCITNGPDRTVDVPLNFLDGEDEATIVRDQGVGESLEREERDVREYLAVSVPENGGFVVRF